MTIDEARIAKREAESEISKILERLHRESGLYITNVSGARYINQFPYMWCPMDFPGKELKIEWDINEPIF